VTYLSSITKGTQLMADVQDKFSLVHRDESVGHYGVERRVGGRGGGMMEDEMMPVGGGGGGGGGAMRRRGPRGQEGGFLSNVLGSLGMNMG
jgi:hypothetical protein